MSRIVSYTPLIDLIHLALYFKTRDAPNVRAGTRGLASSRSERDRRASVSQHVAFSGVKVNSAICIARGDVIGGGCGGETDTDVLLSTSTQNYSRLNDLNALCF